MNELELKKFIFGFSVLETYIKHCKPLNFQDISILSEDFCCDLMNSLYGYHLVNRNNAKSNNPAYDLISQKERIIIQVTTVVDSKYKKVNDSLKTLRDYIHDRNEKERELNSLQKYFNEEKEKNTKEDILNILRKQIRDKETDLRNSTDINGYKLFFIFLCSSAEDVQKHFDKYGIEKGLIQYVDFDYTTNIYDINRFIQEYKSISPMKPQFNDIIKFMDCNDQIFIPATKKLRTKKSKVQTIIDGYSDNFLQPLFQHTYSDNKKVTLQKLYVNPLFIYEGSTETQSRDFLNIYDDFLRKNRKGRILFLEGDAAIGKTSLVSWLCYYYNQRDNTNERSPLGGAIFCNHELVCIRLRDFALATPENILLALHNYFGVEQDDFQEHYAEAVFILDGVDELKFQNIGQDANNTEAFISNFRGLFPKAKFIITSRPLYINKSLLKSDIYDYQTITLSHYTKAMRQEWIDNFCNTGEEISNKTKEYILGLDDDAACGVADTPLALYLLSSCDMKDDMRDNHWFLYRKIFHNAIVKTEYNSSIKLGKGTSHPLENKIDIVYPLLCKIAYRMFQQSKESISHDELMEIIGKRKSRGLTSAYIKRLCLLCCYWAKTEHQSVIEFYHNNIRAFFLAEFIYAQLHEHKAKTTNSILLDELISLFCNNYCYTKVASSTWEQTFSFLYLHFCYDLNESNEGLSLFSQITCRSIKETTEALLNSDAFWEKACTGKYQTIKTIFYNYFMFIQMLYGEFSFNEAANHERFNCNLSGWQEVFNDWYTVFTQRIRISDEIIVGSGSYMQWSNCTHSGKTLDNAYFQHAVFDNVSFRNSSLKKAAFINSELKDVDFTNADLSETDFSNTKLVNVTFNHTILRGARFQNNTIIRDCIWKDNNISEAEFSQAKLYGIKMNGQIIDGTITRCLFDNCELKRANIKNNVYGVAFVNCDLSSIEMNGIELVDSVFTDSELYDIHLISSKRIYNCTFSGRSIIRGHFNNSLLIMCKFIDTNLSYSEFITTKMISTEFDKTKLNGLQLFRTRVDKITYDSLVGQEELFRTKFLENQDKTDGYFQSRDTI